MRFFSRFWLIAVLPVLIVVRSQGQSQSSSTAPYLLFKAGYGMPDSPQLIGNSQTLVNSQLQLSKGIYGSYAKGLNLSLGIGKMINPTFGFEVATQLTLGSAIKSSTSNSVVGVGNESDRATSLILKPLIVIRNSGDLLTIYTKLGLAVAVVSTLHEQYETRYLTNSSIEVIEISESARAKVGFAACFGLAFRVSESFSFLVEANGQLLSLPVSKGHLTKFEVNGVDQLPSIPVNVKSWVYETSLPDQSTADPSKPGTKLFSPAYYSYVGVGAGIMYHF